MSVFGFFIISSLITVSWRIISVCSSIARLCVHLQSSTKRWARALGCVILTSWLPLAAGCEFTQPRPYLLVEPSVVCTRKCHGCARCRNDKNMNVLYLQFCGYFRVLFYSRMVKYKPFLCWIRHRGVKIWYHNRWHRTLNNFRLIEMHQN